MSQLASASLGDLRAITHALCENAIIKKNITDDLQALCNSKPSKDSGETTDLVSLIELATAQQLHNLQFHYCGNEDIKKRVENYLQVLRHTKPAEATSKAAESSSCIKKATPKELHNVMVSLCEDEDAKKRVASHLRVLRRSKAGGAATTGANPDALIDSATEMELRAIGLAMSDADEDVKKRLLESLHVLSIFGELQGTETKKNIIGILSKCTRCNQHFQEGDNNAQSCTYHPGKFYNLVPESKDSPRLTNPIAGRVESGMIPEFPDLPQAVDRWSCCFRPSLVRGCKTQRHQRW